MPFCAPRFDVDCDLVLQCGHGDRRAENRLTEGDVGLVMQVVAMTLKSRVALDAQMHEEPAVRPAAQAGGTSVGKSHRRAVLDARGDVGTQGHALWATTVAVAVGTRLFDARAHSLATRARLGGDHLAEDGVANPAHFATALALLARDGRGAGRTARAVTGRHSAGAASR